jgi:hypothetical protein
MHQPNERKITNRAGNDTSFQEASLSRDPIILSAVDLSSVTDRIRTHNEDIGLGPTLGRLMIGLFSQIKKTPRSERDPKTLLHKALDDEDTRRTSLQASFEAEIMPTLSAVGLKVCPLSKGWSVHGPDTQFQSHRLAFYIDEPAQFRRYLESIEPATVTQAQKRGLTSLLQSLCTQLRRDYDVQQADDRLLALVSVAESICSNYERLGLGSNRFNRYVEAIQGRFLRDLVLTEQLELDKPFEQSSGFTLRWHRDCVASTLEAKWSSVLELLVSLANNSKASAVYAQASETAKAANKTAIQEVLTWEPKRQTDREDFLHILRRAELRLTEF